MTTLTDRAGNPIEIDSAVDVMHGTLSGAGRVTAIRDQPDWMGRQVVVVMGDAQAIPHLLVPSDLLVRE